MKTPLPAALGAAPHGQERGLREAFRKKEEFRPETHHRRIDFTAAARARRENPHAGFATDLLHSRFLVLLTAPVIWLCLLPIALSDLVATFYQAICFPIYGIPKVRRRDYLAFDRHRLPYLNAMEKLNCHYCAYANGILAYFTEIAARTEQHWCPIKHARHVHGTHSRYQRFIDYGDAEKYRRDLESLRRAYDDLEPQPDPRKTS